MEYEKKFLTFSEQADLLIQRGLKADREILIQHLQSVSYYRISAYVRPFRQKSSPNDPIREDLVPGTTFDDIWSRYVFDRRLRLLVMDAIERIEVDIRTNLTYLHAEKHGPFGYADDTGTLPNVQSEEDRERLLEALKEPLAKSKPHEDFVKHFKTKYGSHHRSLPIWAACEVMTFGHLLTFYRASHRDIQKIVARRYKLSDIVFESWLVTLNMVRNVCAHHGRLWNRELGVKPMVPNKDHQWRHGVGASAQPLPDNRVFIVLTMLKFCLNLISPDSQWGQGLKGLLNEFPKIPLRSMGFIDQWESHVLWK
ncbi:Abi family protein [Planctopirus limnophila DSM 3776]|uniref:Abi family protein n=1 Tax=Planctopirus limnophila (strain ATCC 43296 / DSM 3776 / IFAM 1008 / Mu 290) TaxID=521674 RepID=D5SV51_PLAL2|nr:Abi family protein [Planctopirus limnophila]ADG69337.1 Abi family protein [Planctopirus limnophila DSM 3776]